MSRHWLKRIGHICLFVVAYAFFHVGLWAGLTWSPMVGNLMVLVAAVIAGLNIWWMVRSARRQMPGSAGAATCSRRAPVKRGSDGC